MYVQCRLTITPVVCLLLNWSVNQNAVVFLIVRIGSLHVSVWLFVMGCFPSGMFFNVGNLMSILSDDPLVL